MEGAQKVFQDNKSELSNCYPQTDIWEYIARLQRYDWWQARRARRYCVAKT